MMVGQTAFQIHSPNDNARLGAAPLLSTLSFCGQRSGGVHATTLWELERRPVAGPEPAKTAKLKQAGKIEQKKAEHKQGDKAKREIPQQNNP